MDARRLQRCASALAGCDMRSPDEAETARMNEDKSFDAGCCTWSPAETEKYRDRLECGPMPNVMVALPNTGGALCSTPQFG